MKTTHTFLFSLGNFVSTPGAIEALKEEQASLFALLNRHMTGDWGDLCESDKRENDLAVTRDLRILSAYILPRTKVKVWVITEADRSATTFLLPEEY